TSSRIFMSALKTLSARSCPLAIATLALVPGWMASSAAARDNGRVSAPNVPIVAARRKARLEKSNAMVSYWMAD
ncbi:MAG TPA: hypothetical protein PKX94_07350, partial [Opitutales bacterium]|nr:hypothetical protein [Opitutales bacterium]